MKIYLHAFHYRMQGNDSLCIIVVVITLIVSLFLVCASNNEKQIQSIHFSINHNKYLTFQFNYFFLVRSCQHSNTQSFSIDEPCKFTSWMPSGGECKYWRMVDVTPRMLAQCNQQIRMCCGNILSPTFDPFDPTVHANISHPCSSHLLTTR